MNGKCKFVSFIHSSEVSPINQPLFFPAHGKQLYAKYALQNHFISLYTEYMISVSDIVFSYSDVVHRGHVPKKTFGDETGGTAQAQSIPNKSLIPPESNYSKDFSSFT